MTQKAVFLDRDGTVIKHYDYLTEVCQVELVETAVTALKYLKERGYLLILVTNQSGVARGYITEDRLSQIHGQLKSLLAKKGAYLDAIYYCPYHPEAPVEAYRQKSDLRKPLPGMLLQAAAEHDIDLAQSWIIGDDDRDILAGKAAGCRTILILERGSKLVKRGEAEPDYKAGNLQEAANIVAHYSDKPVKARKSPETDKREISTPVEPENPVESGVEEESVDYEPAVDDGVESPLSDEVGLTTVMEEASEDIEIEEAEEREPAIEVKDDLMTFRATEPQVEQHQLKANPIKPGPVEPVKPVLPETEESVVDRSPTTDDLLHRILQELRESRHDRRGGEDFSAFRLIGMIIQMVVVLCLVMAFRAGSGSDPDMTSAYVYLMAALVFQTMSLTFLTGFK